MFIAALLFCLSVGGIFVREAIKSSEEDYYDFLALQGLTERPTLNYRTLSDSVWSLIVKNEILVRGKLLLSYRHSLYI